MLLIKLIKIYYATNSDIYVLGDTLMYNVFLAL